MSKNHYEVLGITRDATPDQIKKAYRKLARKYHPDLSKEADAEEQMQAINVAYETLSKADKKLNMILSWIIHKPFRARIVVREALTVVNFIVKAQVSNKPILVALKTCLAVLVQALVAQIININSNIAKTSSSVVIKVKTSTPVSKSILMWLIMAPHSKLLYKFQP